MPARPRLRLALLVLGLVAAVVCFSVLDLVSAAEVRRWVDTVGPLAPVAFVFVSGVLGALLVPGPLLAGAAGLLFGAAVGTLATIGAAVVSALIAVLIARRSGGEALTGPRLDRVRAGVEEHGVAAVVLQRLIPGVPDGPLSYAFGLFGVSLGAIALGTLIGSAPRAFSYAALGASLDDPESPVAVAGVAVLVVTGVVGAALGRRAVRRSRPGA
jgi:uncharacterized membrane protein YdjX (TVP38/TMEM64 family)